MEAQPFFHSLAVERLKRLEQRPVKWLSFVGRVGRQ